ncbi:MAG TPA: redox-sensitive transcriptional activator SoxR [Acidimicrobiales bacterium]|jgi:MerR family redox-sensitive transcriptional activator SoxR|nr:redox-sensitive transcriptional activator SoxR [Acidimicrobiales bacterium]
MTTSRWTIGELAARSGVAPSALRFYEEVGLIVSSRSQAGQRRYSADVVRRVAFIKIAQRVGLTLNEITEALAGLPGGRTPNKRDWEMLARRWRPRIDAQIALLEGLRDQLSSCIGCGCLSLRSCALNNPADAAKSLGVGPRFLLGDSAADLVARAGAERHTVAG